MSNSNKSKRSKSKTLIIVIALLGFVSLWAAGTGQLTDFNNEPMWLNFFKQLPIDNLIATAFVLVMAIISAFFYNHKEEKYAKDKSEKIKSPAIFRYIYRYLQISTIVVSIGAFLTNHKVLLEVHDNTTLMYMGISIATLAMALFISAKLTLGDHYSPCFDSYIPRDLVKDGLYKYIRHPIYTSNVLMLLGIFVACGSYWILINTGVLTLYYVYSAVKEESALKLRFPVYYKYVKQTNMFLPTPKIFR